MNGEELQRRLDGRPYAWLAGVLGMTAKADRVVVWRWAHDRQPIPDEYARAIRERLPLPDEEVPDGRE